MTSGTRERTLWTGTRPRICSTARKPRKTVSDWMRQAVEEVYRRHLGLPVEWTPEQQERFLDMVTDRLDQKAFDLAGELASAAISHWTVEHSQHPDYLTTVRLNETAQENAREAIARQELYDQIPVPGEGTQHLPPPPITGVPWEGRWRDLRYRAEPTEAIEELVDQVWPSERWTAMFRVVAGYLLATRHEEGLEIPTSPRHFLAERLVPQINEDLAALGYPAE